MYAAPVVPEISLYADGRLLTTRYDGTRWLIQEQRLTTRTYRRIYRDARLAGLGKARMYRSRVQLLDAAPTDVTLLADGRRHVSTIMPGAGGWRVWLIERLSDQLQSMPPAGPAATYRPTRTAIVAWTLSGRPSAAEMTGPEPRPWPLQPFPTGRSVACTVASSADIDAVTRLAGGNPEKVRWRSGQELHLVRFRPLLPDEGTCAGLTH